MNDVKSINVEKVVNYWITSFNINARYDDFKREFFKQCTIEYTDIWIERIKQIRDWIIKKL